MGQENSHEQISESTPPRTLSSRSLSGIASYIKDGRPKRIVVMTGAGISTSAGIPDFRSPDTGLYANLARLNLPYAEAVFDISYFKEHPEPFYVLAKELYPGKFYPTVAHSFIALLHEKGMLQMLFTQNIDCLERRAGVPDEKIVEAHGSFATQRCIECKTSYPDDLMMKAVESGEVPRCLNADCSGLVKPDIVFFGEQLPAIFHRNRDVPATAELVIVLGTSLSVQPFASLPGMASEGVPRVLINKEIVGDLGSRRDDVMVLGNCDDGVRKLADALGWRNELEQMWLEVGGKDKEEEAERSRDLRKGMSKDELLQAEIDKLTGEVEESLKISKDHEEWVKKGLDETSAGKKSPAAERSSESFSVPDKSPEAAPSTLPNGQTPVTTEKVSTEAPAEAPKVDPKAILDTTLPHNRLRTDTSETSGEEKKPSSHI